MILVMVLLTKGGLVVTDLKCPLSLNLWAKSGASVLADLGGPPIADVEARRIRLNIPNISISMDSLPNPRSSFKQVSRML